MIAAGTNWTFQCLQISPPNRLVNLYRGRGGTPGWKVTSLDCWLVWRLGMPVLGEGRARSVLMDQGPYIFGSRKTFQRVCVCVLLKTFQRVR